MKDRGRIELIAELKYQLQMITFRPEFFQLTHIDKIEAAKDLIESEIRSMRKHQGYRKLKE